MRIRQKYDGKILFIPSIPAFHFISRRRLNPVLIMKSAYHMGRTRAILEKTYSRRIMSSEFYLARVVLITRILASPIYFFRDPREAYFGFSVSCSVLFAVALGYLRGLVS
jgi:hypothetical protein